MNIRLNYTILILLARLSVCSQPATSPIRFDHYDVNNGLPASTVNRIMQDSRGFIWASTAQGLSRFDGTHFITYSHSSKDSSTMPFDNVENCIELANHELLISTRRKMWFVNPVNHQQHPPPAFWKNRNESVPWRLQNNLIGIESSDKIYFANDALQVIDSISKPVKIVDKLISLGNNRILVTDGLRYYCYFLATRQLEKWEFHIENEMPYTRYSAKDCDSIASTLYISTYDFAFRLNYNTNNPDYLIPKRLSNWQQNGLVTDIAVRDGIVVLTNLHTVSILQAGRPQVAINLDDADIPNTDPITQRAICFDKQGYCWLFGNTGMSRFNTTQLNYQSWRLPYKTNPSILRYKRHHDKIWMNSEQSGSLYLDLETGKLNYIDSTVIIYCWGVVPVNADIYIYGNGWVNNSNPPQVNTKLRIYNPQTKKISEGNFLKPFYDNTELVTLVYQSRNGDIWYSLNFGGGLIRQQGQTFTQYNRKNKTPHFNFGYVNKVAEDNKGNLYFSCNKSEKILVWKNNTEQFEEWSMAGFPPFKSIHFSGVIDHIIDKVQNLWISNEAVGLLQYNLQTGKGKLYETDDGLPGNRIESLEEDGDGNIWIPTDKGLCCLQKATGRFVLFSQKDGLPFTNFSNTYLFFDKLDSLLYFSKSGWLYRVNGHELLQRKKESAATLFIDKMLVNEQPFYFASSAHISLQPQENNIQFSFILQDIDDKIAVKNYEYLLTRGHEKSEWQALGVNNTVAINGMKPGNYTMQVRMFNDATGKYIYGGNAFHFTIATIWYNQIWFRLLAAGALLLFIFLIFRAYYLRKLDKQKALLEKEKALSEERNRIAADMHDDVGAGLSRIRYISYNLKNNPSLDRNEIDKIVSLSDESVEKMNEIIWALNQGSKQLEEVIYYTRSQCSKMISNAGLEFSFSVPEVIPAFTLSWKDSRDIYLLVKEAVNNAIKHATAKKISVHFEMNGHLIIHVKDDGIGFSEDELQRQGNGLLNYKKRVESLKGKYALTSSKGNGTELLFEIPLAG